MKINNFPIGIRLSLSYGLMLVLLLFAGFAGIFGTSKLSGKMIATMDTDGAIMLGISEASRFALGLRRYEKDIFLNIDNTDKIANYFKKWQQEYAQLAKEIDSLQQLIYLTEEKTALAGMKQGADSYHKGFSEIYAQIQKGQITTPQAGNKAMAPLKKSIRDLIDNTETLLIASNNRIHAVKNTVMATTAQIRASIFSAIVISFVVLVVQAFFMTRSITRALWSR